MIRSVFRYRFVFALFVALVAAPVPRAVAAPDPPDRAGIAIEQGELASISGCQNSYTLYRPARPTTGLTALIVPGFMRDRDRMRGWADEIAGRGMAAVTMDFCQPTAFDGRHAENARDMIAVRAALGVDRVVYVGHSAGGLASLLAAADDAAARGMVLLDPVDFGDLAEDAAARATVPALVLLATAGRLQSSPQHPARPAAPRPRDDGVDRRGDALRFRVAVRPVSVARPAISAARRASSGSNRSSGSARWSSISSTRCAPSPTTNGLRSRSAADALRVRAPAPRRGDRRRASAPAP